MLNLRTKGNFKYPAELNDEVIDLHKLERLHYQNFTDRKEIAERYAKENSGTLVIIDVPIQDILKYFTLEIQNFAKRKQVFEIVYTVTGAVLEKFKHDWSFTIEIV